MMASWQGISFRITAPLWGNPHINSPHKGPVMWSFHDFFVVNQTMYWTNSRVACDRRCRNAVVTSLLMYRTDLSNNSVHFSSLSCFFFNLNQLDMLLWWPLSGLLDLYTIIQSEHYNSPNDQLREYEVRCNYLTIVIGYMNIHHGDVIMGAIASQITSRTVVYSTVYSDADQRKHQSSASLAFVWGIQRGPVNSPHKWPVTRKMFPFDDVIM